MTIIIFYLMSLYERPIIVDTAFHIAGSNRGLDEPV